MTIYGSGTALSGHFGPSRIGPVSLKFKIWPFQHLILYVIIDCNQSAYKKLYVVLGLLPGMFLRDENILIKIK